MIRADRDNEKILRSDWDRHERDGVEWSITWWWRTKEWKQLVIDFGRNGEESDVGLDATILPLRIAARYRGPKTKALRVRPGHHPDHRNDDRPPPDWDKSGRLPKMRTWGSLHYRIEFGYIGRYFGFAWAGRDHGSSKKDPWWRGFHIGPTQLWGRTRTVTETIESGSTGVPMPEGVYPAEWTLEKRTSSYVRWPGTLRDRVRGKRTWQSYWIKIPEGIPHEGKGENSWDCGMDGLFGIGGSSVEDAVANAVRSSLRDRTRYGGPHDLTEPTAVSEFT